MVRYVSPCLSVRHHVRVTGLRPHTKTFSQQARERLGVAVARAREAAGYTRPAFQALSGVGKTSLYYLEKGDPVGAPVYEAVARALPGWTEDTPVEILKDGPIPSTVAESESAANEPPPGESEPLPGLKGVEWTADDERRYQKLQAIFRNEGVELSVRTYLIMKDHFEILERTRRRAGLGDGR